MVIMLWAIYDKNGTIFAMQIINIINTIKITRKILIELLSLFGGLFKGKGDVLSTPS